MVLDESARIAEALLTIEASVDAAALSERTRQLESIRGGLGYTAVALAETDDLVDTRIEDKTPVITPESLNGALPLTRASAETTRDSRQAIGDILTRQADRLLVIAGPCSIHDPEAALNYAETLSRWRDGYGDSLEIIMRCYPEKPRTERGWKGFIYDPLLDESDDINVGIVATRLLTSQITSMGVPLAMERLNALTPQYVNGMVAYDAIGARTTTDQKAREYASGTSSAVGFKNTPEGSIEAAVQAVVSASGPHSFLGMSLNGTPSQIRTSGNEQAHIILRGSNSGPNYTSDNVTEAKRALREKGLRESIGIDASHGNSHKKADKQLEVVADVSEQIAGGEGAIVMVMIEGNLIGGAQKLRRPDGSLKQSKELVYGQSITDECASLTQTEAMLAALQEAVQRRRNRLQ